MLQQAIRIKVLGLGIVTLFLLSSISPVYADPLVDDVQMIQMGQSQNAKVQLWTSARCVYRRCRPLTIR